jgi:transposase-like protein
MMVINRKASIHDLLNPPPPGPLPAEYELIERYRLVRSINGFAFWLGLRRHAAIKLLKSVGIDVYEEVGRAWEAGESIRELSRRHGPERDTISSWIKRTGRNVPLANSRKRYDEQLILEIYEKTNSCNNAANVTCHGIFPPDAIRVRPNQRTDNEANEIHGRTDHRHPGRARGRREVR